MPITPFQYLCAYLGVRIRCPPFLLRPSPILALPVRSSWRRHFFVCRRHWNTVAETTNQPAKTATIEMYAPSSYNDTVTGETLSSVSEKSESYSNEGSSQPEYIVSTARISTYKPTIFCIHFLPTFSPFLRHFSFCISMNMQFVNGHKGNEKGKGKGAGSGKSSGILGIFHC